MSNTAGQTQPSSPWTGQLNQMSQGMTTGMPTQNYGVSPGAQYMPGRMQATADATAKAALPPGEGFGPGFGETYGKEHIGQYDQPTQLEQFAQQQMNGNNPYYARLKQQGMDAINQQMAARGHYNSGGALSALGNYGGAIDASQFKDMADLVGNASGLGLSRQNAGMNAASGIQGLQQGRIGQQFSQASDLAHLGAGTVGGFFGQGGQQSGDAAMAGINAGANSAQLAGQGQNALPNAVLGYFGGRK
jgi:hypothetical protein